VQYTSHPFHSITISPPNLGLTLEWVTPKFVALPSRPTRGRVIPAREKLLWINSKLYRYVTLTCWPDLLSRSLIGWSRPRDRLTQFLKYPSCFAVLNGRVFRYYEVYFLRYYFHNNTQTVSEYVVDCLHRVTFQCSVLTYVPIMTLRDTTIVWTVVASMDSCSFTYSVTSCMTKLV